MLRGVAFGKGTGAILFGYMGCDGTESSLPSCSSIFSPGLCHHSSDVEVWCDSIDHSGECFSAIT